jgi:flagellin-like hook-associated protein FlgL
MANDLSDVQQNSRYELTCGEVTFAIKTGSNNNASWNNIIENIGEGFFTTNYTVGPYYLSRSVHVGIDDDVSRISYAKVQDILNNGGVRLKADLDGMWIQMGSEVLNKKTWAEMGIDYVEGTEKKEYTYSDQGISFTFVPIIGKTKVDLYLGLNDFALNFTYSDPQIDSNGELTYKYGLEPSDIDIMYPGGAYNKYVGPLMKVDQTESTILADSITNTPQYTYYEIEIIEEEIEVPIYEEGQEENGVQSLWIQSGADVEDGMFLVLENMNTSILGIDETDVSTDDGARNAISSIKNAIGKVSAIRSNLGAQQNRLEHTYKNVTNTAENTQASESIIRDTDMAKEMVQLSLKNILEQAGVSMMAQANQTNQGVLSLLQ